MEQEKLIGLVTAARDGDGEAMDALFNAFYNDVYYFALKTVKDSEVACDITQETFVTIITALGGLKEPAAFPGWMKQIAYSQCTRYFRKKKDVLVSEDEDGDTIFDIVAEDRTEFIPDEALDQDDFRATILAILDELSEPQRAAVLLYYYDELSVKEIAQIQGVSEGTVKSRLNYARKSIKASVESYEKKNDVKLHSVAILPLVLWLLRGGKDEVIPLASAKSVASGVTAATGMTVTVAGGAAVAVAEKTAAAVSGGIIAKILGLPVAVKVIAGVTAAAVVIGSVGAAVLLPKDEEQVSLDTVRTRPAVGAVITDPTETEPPGTDPVGTGPAENEPSGTVPSDLAPEETEPSDTKPEETGPQETEPEETVPEETTPEETIPEETVSEETVPEETEPEEDVEYVPEGCSYVMADGTVLGAGEAMPTTVSAGDEFITADYTYKYGYISLADEDGQSWNYKGFEGWSVVINDRSKSTYGPMYSQINGEEVTSLYGTFAYCTAMTTVPELPSTVTDMNTAFEKCSALKKAPILPSNVKTLYLTFVDCIALEEAPRIPDSVTNMCNTFMGCTALETPPEIPVGVELMCGTFASCTGLKTAPVIPNTVRDMSDTFNNCTSLLVAPVIPDSVTTISRAFIKCSSMTSVPRIGSGVVEMNSAFMHCSALTGTIIIDADPEDYAYCFALTEQPIILTGSSTLLTQMAQTAQSGNATVE